MTIIFKYYTGQITSNYYYKSGQGYSNITTASVRLDPGNRFTVPLSPVIIEETNNVWQFMNFYDMNKRVEYSP